MMFHAQAQPWEWAWPAEPAPFRHVTWRVLVPWVGQTLLCQGTALASPSPQERLGVLCLPSPLPQTELPIHVDLKETRNLRSHRQCSSETILPREAPAEAADRSPKSQPRCCSESLGAWWRRAGVWTPGLGTLGPAAPTPTAGEGMAGLLRPQDPQGCLRERGWGGGGGGRGQESRRELHKCLERHLKRPKRWNMHLESSASLGQFLCSQQFLGSVESHACWVC